MHTRPNTRANRARGVGLVQAVVVMVCTAVLLAVGTQAATQLQARWALQAHALRWLEVLHSARAAAVWRQSRVVVCALSTAGSCVTAASPSGWSMGWRTYVDSNANGRHDAAEPVLVDHPALGEPVRMQGNQNVDERVVFEPDGRSNHQSGTWRLCDPRLSQGWAVVINILGRARLERVDASTCL